MDKKTSYNRVNSHDTSEIEINRLRRLKLRNGFLIHNLSSARKKKCATARAAQIPSARRDADRGRYLRRRQFCCLRESFDVIMTKNVLRLLKKELALF